MAYLGTYGRRIFRVWTTATGKAGTLGVLVLGAGAFPDGTSAPATQGVLLWEGCGHLHGEARQQGEGHGARGGRAMSAEGGQLHGVVEVTTLAPKWAREDEWVLEFELVFSAVRERFLPGFLAAGCPWGSREKGAANPSHQRLHAQQYCL